MQQRRKRPVLDMTILGGWLFADLLAALMIVFLAAQSPFPKLTAPIPAPTPSPSPTFVVTPTPTPEPRLDFKYQEVTMNNLDYNGIQSGNPSAIAAVVQFLNSQPQLRHRQAGLVIVYNGAYADADIPTADIIARDIMNQLQVVGKKDALLERASYYGPIYFFGGGNQSDGGHNLAIFDIYLFKQ